LLVSSGEVMKMPPGVLLVVVLAHGLAGCGGSSDE
jgi:hypothetical protein